MRLLRYRKYLIRRKGISLFLLLFLVLFSSTTCTVKKNTALTRTYHNLTTRYNVYYNGINNFDEAYDNMLENLEESYVELIPYAPIYYKANDENASGAFQRAIDKAEKAIQEHSLRQKPKRKRGWKKDPKALAMQKKKEYNPFLYKAWFLLAKAQYYNNEFNKSLSTFAYIANLYKENKELYHRAKLWQVRILILLERLTEAKEILDLLAIDEDPMLDKALKALYPQVLSEYYLQTKDCRKALDYLPLAIKSSKHKVQKARLYYLMGQINLIDSLINKEQAYYCFKKVLRLNPPQVLDFSARLRKAELSPKGERENIRLLKRMSHKRRYQKSLDQIYYALGNSYLALQDSTQALQYFQMGADSSQLKKYDYLLNLMSLGKIYLNQKKWIKAQVPISQVASTLSNTHRDYSYYKHLGKGLDSLIISAQTIRDKDSLLYLAKISQKERNHIIDSVISVLKQKEKEERKKSYVEENVVDDTFLTNSKGIEDPINSFEKGKFYFYNKALLDRGRQNFQRKWGKRKLQDFWQLRKRPVFTSLKDTLATKTDSLSLAKTKEETEELLEVSKSDDPHERAYYLANIPFTPEAQAQAKEEIAEAMLEEARILRDKLDFLQDAYNIYKKYSLLYPKSKDMDKVLYNSYLLALRLNLEQEAESYRLAYLRAYPKTKLAEQLADKNYLLNLQSQNEFVSKRYDEAYKAYLSANAQRVESLYQSVKEDYSKSKLYPRFVFLSAMAKLTQGETKVFQERLKELSTLQADKALMELVGSMLGELKKGRKVIGASSSMSFANGDTEDASTDDKQTTTKSSFASAKANEKVSLIIAIPKHLLSDVELTYYISLYNFVHYTQKSFELRDISSESFSAIIVGQFSNADDAQDYTKQLLQDKDLKVLHASIQSVISSTNATKVFSTEDYQHYLEFLLERQKNVKELKVKLDYLTSKPKDKISAKDKVYPLQEQKQAKSNKPIEGKDIKEKLISYEEIQAIAKQQEDEKKRLAKKRLDEKRAKEKARKEERERKLRERRRLQKEKLKARKHRQKKK